MKFYFATIILLLSSFVYASQELTILTDRSLLHVDPIVKMYEEKYNKKVYVISTKEGTIRSRIGDNSIDVVYSTEVTELEELADKLIPIPQKREINPELVSKDGKWISPSYRIRGAYHRNDYKLSDNWLDISENKICIRPLVHPYNISLFQAISKEVSNVNTTIAEIKEAMITPASGNDRKQAVMMADGKCDVAILNSYYVKIMNEDKSYTGIVKDKAFTALKINGKYVVIQSAIGLLKESNNGREFIDFIMGEESQKFIVNSVGEYSAYSKNDIIGAAGLYNRKDMYLKLND